MTTIEVDYTPKRSSRVKQIEALFDAPADRKLHRSWKADLPLDERDWSIGLIVGPSGAGKTTVAKSIFPDAMRPASWSGGRALVDDFPAGMPIADITALLSSVGLGDVPSWLRPYHTLSTGEQFRADVARQLAEHPDLAVLDEWTSTVDRQVAKVTSAAAAKAVRRRRQRLVAVTCHYDVIDWLQPDWVYEPHTDEFTWRPVQPRPRVEIDVCEIPRTAWEIFRPHHYLSGNLDRSAQCFGAFAGPECIGFFAITHFVHPNPKAAKIRRIRRMVVLPDWQGLGIGTRVEEFLAEDFVARGFRFRALVVHPGLVRHYLRSPRWRCVGKPGYINPHHGPRGGVRGLGEHQSSLRMMQVWGFEYTRSSVRRSESLDPSA